MSEDAEAIFLAMADLTMEQRLAFLQERCGEDPRLRAEVEALLATIDDPDDGFLDPSRVPALDMAAVDGPLLPGTVLGDFLVLQAIGSGGMGVVYAAQQDAPRRTVAIKVLRRGYRHPGLLKRFAREADVLGRLQHHGIAQVLAFHHGDGRTPAHLVMELVDGPPITEYVKAHSLGAADRIELLIQVCDAVQHAHDRGIVHRDLKPANVLVSGGRAKVLDFGIARVTKLDIHTTIQTAHGQLLGTIAYMSPEQLRGESEIDARSDVYSLGVMFYRLMAGRLPFDVGGLGLVEAAHRILHASVPPLGSVDPTFAGPIEHVTGRAMAIDVSIRYPTAAAFAADLRACLEGRGPSVSKREKTSTATLAQQVALAQSPDGRFVALGLAEGLVVVLDAATGASLTSLRGDGTRVARLTFRSSSELTIERASGEVQAIVVAAPA